MNLPKRNLDVPPSLLMTRRDREPGTTHTAASRMAQSHPVEPGFVDWKAMAVIGAHTGFVRMEPQLSGGSVSEASVNGRL